MKISSSLIHKTVFILFLLLCVKFILNIDKKESFLNMEKKYKSIRRGINNKLEGLINKLPKKVNIRKVVKNIKRKII